MSHTKYFCVFLCLMCFTGSSKTANALDRRDLIFHASFEKGMNADFGKGDKTASYEGKVKVVRGRNGGKAVKFTSKGDILRFALKGNVHLPQGAISFWVYEVDTREDQRIWNTYFQVLGKDTAFNILRLWQPFCTAGGLWQSGKKMGFAQGTVPKRARWTHILFTWRKHELRMFIDGKLTGQASDVDFVFSYPGKSFVLGRPKNPTKFADGFHTGEHMLKDAPKTAEKMMIGKEPYGAYLLDDVTIFNRFLGLDEAQAIFSQPLEKALTSGVKSNPTLKILNYVSSARVRVDAALGISIPKETSIIAEVISDDGSPAGIQTPLKQTAGGLEYGYLNVKSLSPGKYSVIVSAKRNGKTLLKTPKREFDRIEPEPWMTNTYGAEDVVLPGFKPLHAEGTIVNLWGRTYHFKNAVMPTQIINQGKEMLARPINWFATVGGKKHSLRVEKVRLVSSSPTRAVYEGQGNLAGLKVRAKVMVEYDGFMKYQITFDPGTEARSVDRLWMDIPLVASLSRNFYHPTRRKGLWPKDWKSPLTLVYKSVITLGTPDICLQWLTESDQYYYPRGNPSALQTLDQNNARIFRTNVIGKKKTLSKPFTLTFAMHAGPVRPRKKNWRGWTMRGRRYLDPQRHTSVNYIYDWWARSPGSLIPRKGFPSERDLNIFKGRIQMTSMHFGGFRHFEEKDPQKRLPEWERYEAEWVRVPPDISIGSAPGWNEQHVDTNSTWGQWHLYNCHKLFSLTGVRGLYYDDWFPGVSKNEAAGSGYVDENGIVRPTYPIYSQREIHRRVYAIVHTFRPRDGIVIIHTASSTLLPVVSFCDIIYDGEILGWIDLVPLDGDYFQTYRNDLFQMLFSCKQYGPVPGFHDMSGAYSSYKEGQEKTKGKQFTMSNQRKLWAKLLLHDIHAQGGFTTGAEELRYFWLDHFDISDPAVKFYSYWDRNPAVKVVRGYWGHGDDRASKMWAVAYAKPGKVLVIVVRDAPNNYVGDITIDVKLDRKRLGLPEGPLRSTDLESLGRLTKGVVDGNILKVPVNVDDFSAVVLEPELQKK